MPRAPLHVLKFGGSSVATAERWHTIADLLRERTARGVHVVTVCSATKGTSDDLEALARGASSPDTVRALIGRLRDRHHRLADDLGVDRAPVDALLDELQALVDAAGTLGELTPRTWARVLSAGELLSTRLGAAFLATQELDVAWRDARELLRAHPNDDLSPGRWLAATCDTATDAELRAALLEGPQVTITQGFLAREAETGDTVLLGRGGSDTAAAYLSAVLDADLVEIWTDVRGLFSAHPGVVPAARPLPQVTYDEATNLAALGAKVLHPRAVRPVREADIPMSVRSTLAPEHPGTRIDGDAGPASVRAITHRTGLWLVELERPARWQSVGFLAAATEVFRAHDVPLDLVSSSEARIQATLDDAATPDLADRLTRITADLEDLGDARVRADVATVSIVGTGLSRVLGDLAPALEELEEARLGAVFHGADDAHLTFVVRPDDAEALVRRLHDAVVPSARDIVLHPVPPTVRVAS